MLLKHFSVCGCAGPQVAQVCHCIQARSGIGSCAVWVDDAGLTVLLAQAQVGYLAGEHGKLAAANIQAAQAGKPLKAWKPNGGMPVRDCGITMHRMHSVQHVRVLHVYTSVLAQHASQPRNCCAAVLLDVQPLNSFTLTSPGEWLLARSVWAQRNKGTQRNKVTHILCVQVMLVSLGRKAGTGHIASIKLTGCLAWLPAMMKSGDLFTGK